MPSLRAFLDDGEVEVAAVITNPDRPSGRGHNLTAPPIKLRALEAGVPVWQPDRPRAILADLRAMAVNACAVVAYGAILPTDVLAAGGAGFVNLHFSLLPAWRGAAPVTHSLLHGETRTGVTCFVLEAGMDTGPILTTAETDVMPGETAGELTARLAELGAPHLVAAVKGLVAGTLIPRPQDDARATLAPKVHPDDARLDWSAPAERIRNAARAFNPAPGAWTTLRGSRLKVHRAELVEGAGEAGLVLREDADGPVVACGQAAVALTEVQPAGKPRMPGAAFVNGYHPAGERLGA